MRPGQPYPATFRVIQVESPRFELGFSPCHGDVFPLDHDPISYKGSFENRTRSSFLPRTRAPGTLTNHLPSVIAEGIEPSISCVSCRCLSRWTTRSSNKVVETGVEPAESLGSRPSRFSGLRTQPYKWRVQESHLAVRAYETRRCALGCNSFWPPSCKPRNRTGLPTL